MIITKKQIIKAIESNELQAGSFAYPVNKSSDYVQPALWQEKPTKKNCKVCAVGALIRSKKRFKTIQEVNHACFNLVRYADLDSFNENCAAPFEILFRELDYLSILSCKFEFLSCIYGKEKTKRELIKYVEKSFPAQFEIELD